MVHRQLELPGHDPQRHDAGDVWPVFWSVPKPGGKPTFVAALDQSQFARYDPKSPQGTWNGSPRDVASSPWQSYARDHLLLLDDGKSLAIRDEATGVTLYDPDGLRMARVCRPFGIPALTERGFAGLTRDEVAWYSERARRLGGWAESGDRRLLAPCGTPNFSADGRSLAFFHWPLGSILRDVPTGRILRADAGSPPWRVVEFAPTPDGRYLVMAGFHPQVRLWPLKPDWFPATPERSLGAGVLARRRQPGLSR